jgi:hypothetical protein
VIRIRKTIAMASTTRMANSMGLGHHAICGRSRACATSKNSRVIVDVPQSHNATSARGSRMTDPPQREHTPTGRGSTGRRRKPGRSGTTPRVHVLHLTVGDVDHDHTIVRFDSQAG